jgi:hypothetical protein
VVDNSNVVQNLGDTLMLGSHSDLINPQRLLITLLSKLEVIKSLAMATHDILVGGVISQDENCTK